MLVLQLPTRERSVGCVPARGAAPTGDPDANPQTGVQDPRYQSPHGGLKTGAGDAGSDQNRGQKAGLEKLRRNRWSLNRCRPNCR